MLIKNVMWSILSLQLSLAFVGGKLEEARQEEGRAVWGHCDTTTWCPRVEGSCEMDRADRAEAYPGGNSH